jgi:hypothetical protein
MNLTKLRQSQMRTRGAAAALMAVAAAVGAAAWGFAAAVGRGSPRQTRRKRTRRPAPARGAWTATGTLLEACTCAVPCSCNFGEGPFAAPYCHAVFGYSSRKAPGTGSNCPAWSSPAPTARAASWLPRRRASTPARREALRAGPGRVREGRPASGPRPFVSARITHAVSGNDLRLDIAGRGGFSARVIIGRDGRTPVVVENNTVWPIERAVKARTVPLRYRDERVGSIRGDGSNANYGAFSFSGPVAREPAWHILRAAPPGTAGSRGRLVLLRRRPAKGAQAGTR